MLAAVWTLRLVLVGGITVVVSGLRVRSNDPIKPVEIVIGALVVWALTGGVRSALRVWRKVSASATRLPFVRSVHAAPAAAATLAALVCAAGLVRGTTTAAGSDASGYVSQADRWLHGTLKPPQPWVGLVPWPNAPWTFAPLGYKPVNDHPPYEQAPTYSPGLPLMMALAKSVGGQAGLFAVVPICGALLVLATYGIGRRLRSPGTGVIAAWLAATTPIVLFMVVSPYSDVPVGAMWALAFFFLIGDGLWSIVLAGFVTGVAILVRPNIAFLAPVLGLWYLVRGSGSVARTLLQRIGDGAVYGVCAAPAVVFLMLLYNYLFGSPFESGYGRFADLLDLANVAPNARNYARWALDNQPYVTVFGLAGFAAWFAWPRGHARRAIVIAALIVAAVTAEYLLYMVFQPDDWSCLRFFIPVAPFLAVAAAGLAAWVIERTPPVGTLAVVVGVIAIGLSGFRTARDRFAFELWHGDRRYIAAASLIRDLAAPNSVVFSMQHSGSLRYYSGLTPIRFDMLASDWGDRALAWLNASGAHSYAVLDESDIDQFRDHFKGQKILDAIAVPVVIYRPFQDGAIVYLFDLTTPPVPGSKPRVVQETDPGRWRDWPAGPTPTLTLHPPS